MKRLLCLLISLLPLPGPAATVSDLAPWLDSLPEQELLRQLETLPEPSATDDAGRTLLHHAVCDAPDQVPLLLAQNVDPGVVDNDGATALHRFFRCGHAADDAALDQVVPALLNAGATVNATDEEGRTPLWLAAAGRHNLAVFEALLAAGADPAPHPEGAATTADRAAADRAWRKLDLLLQLQPQQELTETSATATLAEALWEGAPLPVAKRIRAAGASVPGLITAGGGDLPWRLATGRRLAALDWLLENGFPLNERPPSGYPPLYFATPDASALLLERGADPALTSAEDGSVMAAFITPPEKFRLDAPHFNEKKAALLLDAGYPVDLRDPQGMTALERAVRGNRLWLVRTLLAAGADPTLASGGKASVVPLALEEGRLPMIRALISAVPDFPERHADLLLHYLKGSGADPAVAELLMLKGASITATDGRGNTPLLWAARNERWTILSLLLDNGARRQHTNANGCDLDCYVWKMPSALKKRLRGDGETTWRDRLPRLDDRPTAFFAAALVPSLVFYFLLMAWRLHRHRGLLAPTLDLGITLVVMVLLSSMLFYRCQQCLLPLPHQLPASALLALLLFSGLRTWRR